MQTRRILLVAGLASAMIMSSAAQAEFLEESCGQRPYVGVCAQGCETDGQAQPGSGLAAPDPAREHLATLDCRLTPYLGPACPDAE